MKRSQQIKIAETKVKLAEAKLDLLKLEEEQLQEGKRLKAAILAAVLALGGMSSASAWGKAKKAPDLEQAIEQAVQKLPKTVEIADEDYNLTKEGEELKAVAQKAGYTNEFETTGFNELCNYLADNDCVMLIGGKPFAKVGNSGTSFKAQKLAVERCGLFEKNTHSKQAGKKLKEEVYINGPENIMELYIIKEDEPQHFYGVVYALKKFVGMRLNINLQKLGYKTTQARPESCIYAGGIPNEYEIFNSEPNESCAYIEFDGDGILDAINQTAKELSSGTIYKLQVEDLKEIGGIPKEIFELKPAKNFLNNLKESESQIQSKEFGDWAVCFWKKGSQTIHIARKMENGRWMFGGGKKKPDYESGWLPSDFEWCAKGYFSKEDAIKNAKESALHELNESEKKSLKEKRVSFVGSDPNLHDPTEYFAEVGLELKNDQIYDKGRWIGLWDCTPNNYYIALGGEDLDFEEDIIWEGHSVEELKEDLQDFVKELDIKYQTIDSKGF